MRIKHKIPPKSGETKVVTKFAFIPITIGYETRWLEKVTYKKKCRLVWCYDIGLHCSYEWENIEFID